MLAVRRAPSHARGEALAHPGARGGGEPRVALDDDDLGSRQHERVRDPRAHAAAAEHADVPRDGVTFFRRSRNAVMRRRFSGLVEQLGLRLEVDAGVRVARRGEDALGELGGTRVVGGDPVGDGVRGGEQLAGGVDAAPRPARRECRVGVDDASGQQQLDREGVADDLFEPPGRAGRGDDAEAGLGVAEARVGRRDPDVGGVREFGAAAECPAVDGGDDRHRQLVDPDERVRVDAGARVVGAALAQLGDVGAGGEHAARAR